MAHRNLTYPGSEVIMASFPTRLATHFLAAELTGMPQGKAPVPSPTPTQINFIAENKSNKIEGMKRQQKCEIEWLFIA